MPRINRIPPSLPPSRPNNEGDARAEEIKKELWAGKYNVDEKLDAATKKLVDEEPSVLGAYREGKRKKP